MVEESWRFILARLALGHQQQIEQGVDNIDIGESQVQGRDGDNEFTGRVSRDDIGSVIQIQDSCDDVDSDHSEGVCEQTSRNICCS